MSEPAVFDAIASTYDSDFSNSLTGKAQRNRVWHFLAKDLPKNKKLNILEINCGTGVDAKWLTDLGHDTVATDISPEMIELAKQKNTAAQFQVCGFDELRSSFQGKHFDVIFSNFAGLNCLNGDDLRKTAIDLASIAKPNGLFIGVFLGKKPLIERLYFGLKGQWNQINRRLKPASVKLNKAVVQNTWYYSQSELESIFQPFKHLQSKPVGLFIFPSYLEPLMQKFPWLHQVLLVLESLFGNISLFSDYGDHIYVVYQKHDVKTDV